MGSYQKNKKSTGGGKKNVLRLIVIILCLAAVGTGINFYMKHLTEKKRQMELAEQRRLEELERERLRKLLEEKRKEFDALVAEMKRYYETGDFTRARAVAQKALLIAEKYGFETDEIYRILRLMDVAGYSSKIKELEDLNADIYKYLIVRTEALKIPSFPELKARKESIIFKTYENEYMVTLNLAKESVEEAKKGKLVEHNYFLSREYLDKARELRNKRNLSLSPEEQRAREMQRDLFLSSKELMKETIPPNL